MNKLLKLFAGGLLICLSTDSSMAQTNNAFGDNQAQVEPGVFAIYAGDLNQDGFVDVFDYPIFDADNAAFASGYIVSDMNGDGFTDVFDFPIFDANNQAFVMVVTP